jgi:hypothetical protein
MAKGSRPTKGAAIANPRSDAPDGSRACARANADVTPSVAAGPDPRSPSHEPPADGALDPLSESSRPVHPVAEVQGWERARFAPWIAPEARNDGSHVAAQRIDDTVGAEAPEGVTSPWRGQRDGTPIVPCDSDRPRDGRGGTRPLRARTAGAGRDGGPSRADATLRYAFAPDLRPAFRISSARWSAATAVVTPVSCEMARMRFSVS